MNLSEAYTLVFAEYPDVVNTYQMREMLGGISLKTVYKIPQSGEVQSFVIGRRHFIPKVSIFKYMGILE